MLGLLRRWQRRLLRSVENELPVLQQTACFCLTPRVLNLTTSLVNLGQHGWSTLPLVKVTRDRYLEGPLASWVLAPVVDGEERPVFEAGGQLVLWARKQQRRASAAWGGQNKPELGFNSF